MKTKINIFLEFVELRTKVASFFPMIIGFLWSWKLFGKIDVINTLLFAGAVLLFDMCTTAINNAVDYHKAVDLDYKTRENVIGLYQLNFSSMVRIIVALLCGSIVLSLILVWRTDVLLLILGIVCFAIGIGYTFGPMPLSRLPLGELFSGITMGFGILYLSIYVSNWQQLLSSNWQQSVVLIQLNWLATLHIIWLSLPLVALISAIMLANNTCDLKTDIQNERYTLVYYIGVQNALNLYKILNMLPWIVWLSFIISGQLSVWSVIGLAIMPLHYRCVARFVEKQVKQETFVESVKSFILFSLMYVVTLASSL